MDKITRIKEIINEIKPFIENDGGSIEFVKYEDNIVYVSLSGACKGCPMAEVTLKEGVESLIINELPEVKAVVNIEKN